MIERIYSNVAIFHDSDRIITTYKFEETQQSQLVKSHVAKALSLRRQCKNESSMSEKKLKTAVAEHGLGGLPSPPVDSPAVDEMAVSPIALDAPASSMQGEDMVITSNAQEQEEEGEVMSEADIMEKLAQLKAEKHRLFQQVKNMISKETTTPPPQDSAIPDSNALNAVSIHVDTQSPVVNLSNSRPSSPPTSPHRRLSYYPSPSSPNGSAGNFKNVFKFNDRPFSRTPYVCIQQHSSHINI
jgi:hypothetical protein